MSGFGLGIDAGGTYTDAVVFDFTLDRVVAKAKAFTTPWDFAEGIAAALDGLDRALWPRLRVVSVSTTLATNAIVEGRGQEVGLLLMPPYGHYDPAAFRHSPIAVVRGQLEIDGSELQPVDADEVRRVATGMASRGVAAFAVAGYASHNNPSHEMAVREIVRRETGLNVTCGHELSDGLNYRIRAETAALNARITPLLGRFLRRLGETLAAAGIRAPVMVVRSDGTLMNLATALERPLETLLSGPAASVAGARHLAALDDALVVDVGGTTTDLAIVRGGRVELEESGATVGGWQTHVKALKMRSRGLGGDSRLLIEKGVLHIGPERVTPVSWLAAHVPGAVAALDWLEAHRDDSAATTRGLDVVALHDAKAASALAPRLRGIGERLAERPYAVQELAEAIGCVSWRLLPLAEMRDERRILWCGLTPTDLLHVAGRVNLWDGVAARRATAVFAALRRSPTDAFAAEVLAQFMRELAAELAAKEMEARPRAEGGRSAESARVFVGDALRGGSDRYEVAIRLRHPVIGIGAPTYCFLPGAAAMLGTRAVMPEHADVANAIGAIVSSVVVSRRARIAVNERGRYTLRGWPNAPSFSGLDEVMAFAVEHLRAAALEAARHVGTDETRVEIVQEDHVARAANGDEVFLGRSLEARVTGRPSAG